MSYENGSAGGKKELPAAFVEEMKELFGKLPGVSVSELPAFLESLSEERSYGLRRNPLKVTREAFEEALPFALRSVPWAEEGYFYEKEERPGKSPYHEAGAYYMQEPSAMIAVRLLGAEPGECIADLCAAPGGKSTQIAGKMQGEGLLVCNEYVPARAEILARNMERMGIENCVILTESIERMAERFPVFFDRVLIDAPCSGEGMFRKEEQALLQWSPENVLMCAERQRGILESAAGMVKPGGVLVYSTCTFSEAEDEAVIQDFLERHKEFYADEAVLSEELSEAGVCPGGLPGTVRMWPHKLCGEGHFAAKLCKRGGWTDAGEEKEYNERLTEEGRKAGKESAAGEEKKRAVEKTGKNRTGRNSRKRGGICQKEGDQEKQNDFLDFCKQYFSDGYLRTLEEKGEFTWRDKRLYLVPAGAFSLAGLRVERSGLYLGEAKKGRFEPSHTWAMTLKKEDVRQWVEVEDAAAYLRGETLENRGLSGWTLVLFLGLPLGWGKAGGNMVKNHYPKGLRVQL